MSEVTGQKQLKIYVASSWRNEYQQDVVKLLRDNNFEVYDFKNPPKSTAFSWSTIDKNWKNWSVHEFVNALDNRTAVHGFASDLEGMFRSDICVLVLPCGRSAHVEAGWLSGKGKKVIAFIPIPIEPELMYNLFDHIVDTEAGLISILQQYKRKGQ